MRCANKIWQQGFENTITKLRISIEGPPMPVNGTFSQRFPSLVFLDLGESPVAEADLAQLAGLKHLRTLILGGYNLYTEDADGGELLHRLTGVGFPLLAGLQLEDMGLSGCKKVPDSALEGLRGQPLTNLDLSACRGLVGSGFQYLLGMPLATLDLGYCENVTSINGLRGLPLTSLNLAGCIGLKNLEGLRMLTALSVLSLAGCTQFEGAQFSPLMNLPLTDLDFEGCKGLKGDGLKFLWGMPLTHLNVSWCPVLGDEDLRFLVGLPIKDLVLDGCEEMVGKGLGYIAGLPLEKLSYRSTNIRTCYMDGLAGSPLTELDMSNCWKASLWHVGKLPNLISLNWGHPGRWLMEEELRYLRGLPLTSLTLGDCHSRNAGDIAAGRVFNHSDFGIENLRDMPLTFLDLRGCFHLTSACLGVLSSLADLETLYLPDGSPQLCADAARELEPKGVDVFPLGPEDEPRMQRKFEIGLNLAFY